MAVGIIAKKRQANFFAWAGLTACAFLLIDRLLAVRLAGKFVDAFASNEGAFLAVALLKCAFGGISIFGVNLALGYTRKGKSGSAPAMDVEG